MDEAVDSDFKVIDSRELWVKWSEREVLIVDDEDYNIFIPVRFCNSINVTTAQLNCHISKFMETWKIDWDLTSFVDLTWSQ